MKNLDERIIIQDAKKGDVLQELDPYVLNPVTVSYMISDYLEADMRGQKNGLIIKYGLRTR